MEDLRSRPPIYTDPEIFAVARIARQLSFSMSATVGVSRQRSVSNKGKGLLLPPNPKARVAAEENPFEPFACTASLLLFAQGSTVVCLHHDTLAVERRFQKHAKEVILISADNVSETGAGRLVVTYDVGQTAIVWDLFTGEQLSRFVSYESLKVAHWMRNGNVAFGKSVNMCASPC